jgi:hypothetical protein
LYKASQDRIKTESDSSDSDAENDLVIEIDCIITKEDNPLEEIKEEEPEHIEEDPFKREEIKRMSESMAAGNRKSKVSVKVTQPLSNVDSVSENMTFGSTINEESSEDEEMNFDKQMGIIN